MWTSNVWVRYVCMCVCVQIKHLPFPSRLFLDLVLVDL